MGILFFWLFLYVDSLFSEMNVVSFFLLKKTLSIEWMFVFFCSFMQMKFLYHCTSTDFFHILQISYEIKKYIPMRIWPYASLSLHVTDLETMYLSRLSEYGTEENLDWIYAIWFWPVLHLTLLVVVFFLPPFVFSFALFPPPRHHGLCLLPLCWSWQLFAWLFYSVKATKESIQIVFYVTRGKTSDRCSFCFSG